MTLRVGAVWRAVELRLHTAGHEYNPCGLGFIVEDSLSEGGAVQALARINALSFERVGQLLALIW